MTKKEVRKSPRVNLRIVVHVEQQSRLQQFFSKNLSSGGIFLEMGKDAPKVGAKLTIAFEVPGLDKKITAQAQVVHRFSIEEMDSEMRQQTKMGIGLKFLNLSETDKKLISEYITGKGLHVEP